MPQACNPLTLIMKWYLKLLWITIRTIIREYKGFDASGLAICVGWGVLGQRTAVAMGRQLVESRPDFLTNPKEAPHGKASKEREDYE